MSDAITLWTGIEHSILGLIHAGAKCDEDGRILAESIDGALVNCHWPAADTASAIARLRRLGLITVDHEKPVDAVAAPRSGWAK